MGIIAKGVFLVRHKAQEALTVACDSNGILFDKKNRSLLRLGLRTFLMRKRALPLSLYGLGSPGLVYTIGGIKA